MSTLEVAIIGTGPDPTNPSEEGFAMGYRHAEAYRNHDDCEVVACADIVRENALAFADEFGIGEGNVFEEYAKMLAAVEPDLVSVTVPPAIHEAVVVGCAESGNVDAIHCEKPMADTLTGARRMVEVCEAHDVQLTFNRQRRFSRPITEATRLIDAGRIGSLERIEINWGDFFDTGAHTVDLAGKFNDEQPGDWVIAQLDYREEDLRFGRHQENQIWAQWRYENGVYGMMATGEGATMIDAAFVLRGTEGTIYIEHDAVILERNGDRESIDLDGETLHGAGEDDRLGSVLHDRSIAEVIEALRSGGQSELSGRIGLRTADILFGGYESVRRTGRVGLPADVEDNPLEAMVETGELSPAPIEE